MVGGRESQEKKIMHSWFRKLAAQLTGADPEGTARRRGMGGSGQGRITIVPVVPWEGAPPLGAPIN